MVSLGMISAAAVEEALALQQMLQGSIEALLTREAVMTVTAR
jgi:hypothetical protein